MKCRLMSRSLRSGFTEHATENIKMFLTFDQLINKFGEEFFQLNEDSFKVAIYFEVEKVF